MGPLQTSVKFDTKFAIKKLDFNISSAKDIRRFYSATPITLASFGNNNISL